ncbi:Golgi-associated plant pathogenesis-related protein 1 [Nematostella vectensis]|uniref:Golgi-associated plant pathogenesis-related protein 1 n=1 Tax=Nematostella vectensis TaxID=45351 RepID=UPI002077249F|nr:Golgi-associated plant pathogenesis-related protein 1 [Nematostella vectensis]
MKVHKLRSLFALCGIALLLAMSEGSSEFKDEILEWHNYYRKIHQVDDLTWSESLQNASQAYAEQLALEDKLGNDGSSNVIQWPGLPSNIGEKSVKFIYKEQAKYNYDSPGFSFSTGHFSLMVWNASRQLGGAWARNTTSGRSYVVFKYNPLGNSGGSSEYEKNVLRPVLPLCNATLDVPTTRMPCRWPSSSQALEAITAVRLMLLAVFVCLTVKNVL